MSGENVTTFDWVLLSLWSGVVLFLYLQMRLNHDLQRRVARLEDRCEMYRRALYGSLEERRRAVCAPQEYDA